MNANKRILVAFWLFVSLKFDLTTMNYKLTMCLELTMTNAGNTKLNDPHRPVELNYWHFTEQTLPGTLLGNLHELTHLILTTLWCMAPIMSLYYSWWNWDAERLRTLPKVTQRVSNLELGFGPTLFESRAHILNLFPERSSEKGTVGLKKLQRGVIRKIIDIGT